MRLEKIIFSGIVMVLLSSCGGDSGGSDEGENNAPTVNAGIDKSVRVNETVSLNVGLPMTVMGRLWRMSGEMETSF